MKNAETLILRTQDSVRAAASRLNSYGGTESEREDKAKRKQKIKKKITGGEMLPFRWAVGEVIQNGLKRRVNGQHSSEVFLELDAEDWIKVRFPVVVIWEEYDCDTMRDLPALFEQFDPSWSSRNTEDLIGAHFGIHDGLLDRINRYVASRVTRGMLWYVQKVEGRPRGEATQFQIVHDNHDTHAFLTWCGSFLQKGKTDELFHPAVIGAMRHTFSEDDAETQAFWKRVAAGKAQNEEGSGAYKLACFLEMLNDPRAEWPRTIAKHFARSRQAPSESQVFATCLNACHGELAGKRLGDIFDAARGKQSVREIAESFGHNLPAAA